MMVAVKEVIQSSWGFSAGFKPCYLEEGSRVGSGHHGCESNQEGGDGEPQGQGFGSGSGLDPDSIRSVDPDPYSESGSGSRRAKTTHKSRFFVEISCFEELDFLFREL
jgi:hypothetical protein